MTLDFFVKVCIILYVIIGFLKLFSRECQSDGPATEKARGPSVLSRHHGTIGDAAVLRRHTLAVLALLCSHCNRRFANFSR